MVSHAHYETSQSLSCLPIRPKADGRFTRKFWGTAWKVVDVCEEGKETDRIDSTCAPTRSAYAACGGQPDPPVHFVSSGIAL